MNISICGFKVIKRSLSSFSSSNSTLNESLLKMASSTPAKELGFSVQQGANWSEYLSFRPIYPASFFDRIYAYHAAAHKQASPPAWSLAHDVGAGCGIVSNYLAARFDHVVISDPNDGYTTLARKLLVEDSGQPDDKFTFLQEGAEESSVASGTVDLVAACECMQWTDPPGAVRDFARQLKAGGTLAMTYYTRPLIVGNEPAQKVWARFWDSYTEKSRSEGEWLHKAFPIINTGFETIRLSNDEWEKVKRVYINARGTVDSFNLNHYKGGCRVTESEERIWVENDEDWSDEQDINWFKGYFATWVPRISESDIQELWDELEHALGGQKVKMETPIVMVLATKKG